MIAANRVHPFSFVCAGCATGYASVSNVASAVFMPGVPLHATIPNRSRRTQGALKVIHDDPGCEWNRPLARPVAHDLIDSGTRTRS